MKKSDMKYLSVTMPDGAVLAATLFEPADSNNQAVLVAPAIGVKQTYYYDFAGFMADNGLAVLTFDYRGVGQSLTGDIKSFKARMGDWAETDLPGMLDWASKNMGCRQLFIVAHSVGGQALGVAENCDRLDGAVMIAAAHGYCGNWRWPASFFVKLFWKRITPLATRRRGYFPGKRFGLGENLPAGIALEWAAWCLDPDYLFGKYPEVVSERYRKLCIPILSYSFTDDRLANGFRVEKLMEKFSSAAIERRHIDPGDTALKKIGHFGFFLKELAPTLWTETLRWLITQTEEPSSAKNAAE